MIVVEYQGVELDHCLLCGGVWFDRSELEELLGAAKLSVDDLNIEAATREAVVAGGEKPRRCPLCRRKMKKLQVGGADPLIVDRCENHGGYWFDGGELSRSIRSNLPEGEWKNIAGFLSDVFPFDAEK